MIDSITSALRVISTVCSEDLNDPDDISMVSWSEDDPLPCYYFGAWEDEFDFLGDNDFAAEQREQPQRWFFTFNRIPSSFEEIQVAVRKWA